MTNKETHLRAARFLRAIEAIGIEPIVKQHIDDILALDGNESYITQRIVKQANELQKFVKNLKQQLETVTHERDILQQTINDCSIPGVEYTFGDAGTSIEIPDLSFTGVPDFDSGEFPVLKVTRPDGTTYGITESELLDGVAIEPGSTINYWKE